MTTELYSNLPCQKKLGYLKKKKKKNRNFVYFLASPTVSIVLFMIFEASNH